MLGTFQLPGSFLTLLALIWWRHHLIWSGTIRRHSLSAPGASTLALCHRRKLSSSRNHQSSMWNQGCYLRPHEIIHSKHDGLWYRVDIRIVEVQDWNWPSDSSDDGTPLDNFDSDEDEYPGFEQRCRSKPWPKRTRFDDGAGSSSWGRLGAAFQVQGSNAPVASGGGLRSEVVVRQVCCSWTDASRSILAMLPV